MAVTLNKANLVLKDANGNIGKIEQLSDRDLTKIRTAVSDLALVVNQSNHTPIEATTTNKGVVQLATSADVVSGASDKVVTAEQLHNATTGTPSDLATYVKDITASNATITVTKGNGTTSTAIINNVANATNATKAIQDKNGAQIDTTYFKSANGTFTGAEYYRDVNNSVLGFNGGNSRDGGARLRLFGKNAENNQGLFDLVACTKEDGSDAKQLFGTPTGVLQWDNKNIVRSVNGVNADDNGNVSITSVNHATNADHAGIADSATKAIQDKNGAQIDTTYFKSANGTFTGEEYFRDVSNSILRFNGGNTHDGGASLMLYGKDANFAQGNFDLVASTKEDATDAKQLVGTPAGSLTWDTKEIVRSVNGVNADGNGNVVLDQSIAISASGTNYIRFANGTQICWGYAEYNKISSANVTLPVPFANTDYQVVCSDTREGRFPLGAAPAATTYFTVYLPSTLIGFRYIAIGNWK